MSLAASTTVTLPYAPTAMCNLPMTPDTIAFVSSAGAVHQLDIGSSVVAKGTTISSPQGIASLGATAQYLCVGSGGLATVAIHDLSASSSTTFAGLDFMYDSTMRPQQIAGTPSGYGAMCCFTAGNLVMFSLSPAAAVLVTPAWLSGTKASCVIPNDVPGAADRFIFGTELGQIVEVSDDDFRIVHKSYAIPSPPVLMASGSGSVPAQRILSMAYSAGFLLVSTNYGALYVFSHITGKLLHTYSAPSTGLLLSNVNDAEIIATPIAAASGSKPILHEIDIFKYPLEFKGAIHLDESTTGIRAVGITANDFVWALNPATTTLRIISESAKRALTTQNITADPTSSEEVELLFIKDAGVAGTAKVELVQSVYGTTSHSVLVSSSSEYLRIARYKTGANEEIDARRVST